MTLHYQETIDSGVVSIYFSSKAEGDMRFEKNRKRFLRGFGIDTTSLILLEQVHGAGIGVATEAMSGTTVADVDSLIMNETEKMSNQSIGVRTADCIPLIIVDKKTGKVGAGHAGWQGVIQELPSQLIQKFVSLGSSTGNLRIYIGPHIHRCCYDVPLERAIRFKKAYGEETASNHNSKEFLDLSWAVRHQLQKNGIQENQIIDTDICTHCNHDTYYSFRHESKETFGEQMAVVYTHRVQ